MNGYDNDKITKALEAIRDGNLVEFYTSKENEESGFLDVGVIVDGVVKQPQNDIPKEILYDAFKIAAKDLLEDEGLLRSYKHYSVILSILKGLTVNDLVQFEQKSSSSVSSLNPSTKMVYGVLCENNIVLSIDLLAKNHTLQFKALKIAANELLKKFKDVVEPYYIVGREFMAGSSNLFVARYCTPGLVLNEFVVHDLCSSAVLDLVISDVAMHIYANGNKDITKEDMQFVKDIVQQRGFYKFNSKCKPVG